MKESYKERVLRLTKERGDFVAGDDGYYVFWPTGRNIGAIGAAELRILADELDRMNALLDAEMNAFFDKLPQ